MCLRTGSFRAARFHAGVGHLPQEKVHVRRPPRTARGRPSSGCSSESRIPNPGSGMAGPTNLRPPGTRMMSRSSSRFVMRRSVLENAENHFERDCVMAYTGTVQLRQVRYLCIPQRNSPLINKLSCGRRVRKRERTCTFDRFPVCKSLKTRARTQLPKAVGGVLTK